MPKLILIRHGQTDYNSQNKYCGFSNPPLNEKGVAQARKLSAELKSRKIDKVYSSDLKRAHQTAEIVFPGFSVEKRTGLREINFGLFEGLDYRQITQKYPAVYKSWVENPLEAQIPKGESLKIFAERVIKGLEDIFSENKGKTIALVTHGGPIRVITLNKREKELKDFWDINQDLGTYSVIE